MASKKKKQKSFKENIEDFFYSDNAAATATKFVLAAASLGLIVCGGVVVPGMIQVIKEFENVPEFSDEKIKNAYYALKRRKFIKIKKEKNGKIKVKITAKGEKRMREFIIGEVKIEKLKKWDGKWRVLIFDIPVNLNAARVALRRKIKELGFYQFQGSVWIYPYPCEDEILFVAEFFKVSEFVEVITADSMLHEKELKKYFKIK